MACRTVGELEQELLRLIPVSHAEAWDRTGLLVGDPSMELAGVLVCLDPTVEAVRRARSCGANVVLTHHPAFLDPPDRFGPSHPLWPDAGSVVFEAASSGVALMNFHTALDVSPLAFGALPGSLGLEPYDVLEKTGDDPLRGYGQMCRAGGITLEELCSRARAALGGSPRMWGDASRSLETVVTWTGSAGDCAEACLAAGIDCLVCGEVKYHAALAAAHRGLSILELGHDISEFPLCDVLVSCLSACGLPASRITCFDQHGNWR